MQEPKHKLERNLNLLVARMLSRTERDQIPVPLNDEEITAAMYVDEHAGGWGPLWERVDYEGDDYEPYNADKFFDNVVDWVTPRKVSLGRDAPPGSAKGAALGARQVYRATRPDADQASELVRLPSFPGSAVYRAACAIYLYREGARILGGFPKPQHHTSLYPSAPEFNCAGMVRFLETPPGVPLKAQQEQWVVRRAARLHDPRASNPFFFDMGDLTLEDLCLD
jgi:hypothetical protein